MYSGTCNENGMARAIIMGCKVLLLCMTVYGNGAPKHVLYYCTISKRNSSWKSLIWSNAAKRVCLTRVGSLIAVFSTYSEITWMDALYWIPKQRFDWNVLTVLNQSLILDFLNFGSDSEAKKIFQLESFVKRCQAHVFYSCSSLIATYAWC